MQTNVGRFFEKSNIVGLEPTIPFDEHYMQMQALVIAKTGLPLYDLR